MFLGDAFSPKAFHLRFIQQGTIPAGYFREMLLVSARFWNRACLSLCLTVVSGQQTRIFRQNCMCLGCPATIMSEVYMPSHSERVRRNYDPAETTGQQSQPSGTPEWEEGDAGPIEPGVRPIPPQDGDGPEAVEQNPN